MIDKNRLGVGYEWVISVYGWVIGIAHLFCSIKKAPSLLTGLSLADFWQVAIDRPKYAYVHLDAQ